MRLGLGLGLGESRVRAGPKRSLEPVRKSTSVLGYGQRRVDGVDRRNYGSTSRRARNLISAQVGADDILRAASTARDVPGRAVGRAAAPGPEGADTAGAAAASEACSAAPEARGVVLLKSRSGRTTRVG